MREAYFDQQTENMFMTISPSQFRGHVLPQFEFVDWTHMHLDLLVAEQVSQPEQESVQSPTRSRATG
jgi:hypothetical protein